MQRTSARSAIGRSPGPIPVVAGNSGDQAWSPEGDTCAPSTVPGRFAVRAQLLQRRAHTALRRRCDVRAWTHACEAAPATLPAPPVHHPADASALARRPDEATLDLPPNAGTATDPDHALRRPTLSQPPFGCGRHPALHPQRPLSLCAMSCEIPARVPSGRSRGSGKDDAMTEAIAGVSIPDSPLATRRPRFCARPGRRCCSTTRSRRSTDRVEDGRPAAGRPRLGRARPIPRPLRLRHLHRPRPPTPHRHGSLCWDIDGPVLPLGSEAGQTGFVGPGQTGD